MSSLQNPSQKSIELDVKSSIVVVKSSISALIFTKNSPSTLTLSFLSNCSSYYLERNKSIRNISFENYIYFSKKDGFINSYPLSSVIHLLGFPDMYMKK